MNRVLALPLYAFALLMALVSVAGFAARAVGRGLRASWADPGDCDI